jgi:hypothetical protein
MSETQKVDGTKPAAMAIPKGGFFKDKVEQGRYGPIFPKSPACYGFSILAKIIPGRPIRKTITGLPGFTTVRGGAYFFLPGIKALRYLATLDVH